MSCNSSHYSVLDSYHKAIAQSFKVIQDMFDKITGIKQSNTFLGSLNYLQQVVLTINRSKQ